MSIIFYPFPPLAVTHASLGAIYQLPHPIPFPPRARVPLTRPPTFVYLAMLSITFAVFQLRVDSGIVLTF
ncbi:MAG TPA: hypothetical protein VEU97_07115 [Ktedonobacteraceae bacterium]|nr:hypothetical protein [Ktedonobacteraceae bacterium]